MFFFKKKDNEKHEERLNQLHFAVANSFSRVREDTSNLFDWLVYLYQQNGQQQQLIQDMSLQLNNIPTTKEAVKHVIDTYYSYEHMMAKIRQLDEKLSMVQSANSLGDLNVVRAEMVSEVMALRSELRDEISRRFEAVSAEQKPILERLRELAGKVDSLEKKPVISYVKPKEERISSLRERIVKRVVRRSKDYVKGMILSLIRKYDRIPAMDLREMLVEDQQLCSKSSFYRLLQELEDNELVDVVSDGKEKIYLAKALKENVR